EDPYIKARVAIAEKVLQEFLQHNGFFQANVHADSQIDDDKQLVNVTFAVKLGKRARVGSVIFKGTNDRETASLQHSLRSIRARLTWPCGDGPHNWRAVVGVALNVRAAKKEADSNLFRGKSRS
ncbi:MAG: hypothetical protein DMG95_05935, partial [Acidobacteria bacterium]